MPQRHLWRVCGGATPAVFQVARGHREGIPINIYTEADRAVRIAVFMLENDSTVRKTAVVFGLSKSTVHKDITARLQYLSKPLYGEIAKLMEKNKNERHIRGGMATKLKYMRKKEDIDNGGKIL